MGSGIGANAYSIASQHIVNVDYIKHFMKGEGTYLVMSNDVSIPVARNQNENLVQ